MLSILSHNKYPPQDLPTADFRGKSCLVTGATSGHGEACAKYLASQGGRVTLLGRNKDRCLRVLDEITKQGGRADILLCDLSSRDSIDNAAREFLDLNRPLDLLLNNAGLVCKKRLLSRDGSEMTFAVNYLAQFQLTAQLLPALQQAPTAKIVNVASDAHRVGSLPLDDLDSSSFYNLMFSYARSKLAIMYFSRDLARRLVGTGITVNSVDPGPIASGIADHESGLLAVVAQHMIKRTFPHPLRAAQTALHLCLSPEMAGRTGEYWRFMKCKEPRLAETPDPGAELWRISEERTGVRYPA